MPHGGYKQSGYGKDMSMYSLEDYTQIKHVMWVARLTARAVGGTCERKEVSSTMTVRPFLVNGEWRTGEGTFEVRSPYDDAVVAEIGVPTAERRRGGGRDRGRRRSRSPSTCPCTRAPRRSTTSRAGWARRSIENAELIAQRGRQAAQVGDGRGHAGGLHVPLGRRGAPPRRRRADAPGHRGRARLARRADPPVPVRAGARDHAVQLPAEPRGAQGRARRSRSARRSS